MLQGSVMIRIHLLRSAGYIKVKKTSGRILELKGFHVNPTELILFTNSFPKVSLNLVRKYIVVEGNQFEKFQREKEFLICSRML